MIVVCILTNYSCEPLAKHETVLYRRMHLDISHFYEKCKPEINWFVRAGTTEHPKKWSLQRNHGVTSVVRFGCHYYHNKENTL
jgi:hypothetical protein